MVAAFQLLLDLFGDAEPAPAPPRPAPQAPATPAAAVPDQKPNQPGVGVPPRSRAPKTVAPAGTPALADPSLREHVHPRANREALIGATRVAYEFRRGRRRNIGFLVSADGLVVSAPRWVPLGEVDAAVQSKARWILAKLAELRDRHERVESTRIEWKEGATFPFLGEPVIVVLDPRHAFDDAGAVLNVAHDALPGVPRHTLHLGLPHHATPEQIRDAAQAWLMRQAKRLFTERLDHYAPRLGVRWTRLSLSSAGTLWGTAHSSGAIRLNWRLIHFGLPVIDYVVAHELSHLRVMNHSPAFWQTVASVVPDYAALRAKLKGHELPPW